MLSHDDDHAGYSLFADRRTGLGSRQELERQASRGSEWSDVTELFGSS